MNKKITFLLLFLFLGLSLFHPLLVESANRANCDLCGYCVNYDPYTQTDISIRKTLEEKWTKEGKDPNIEWPKWVQNWQKCQKCLYPDFGDSVDPLSNQTLNNLPTPYPNRAYTMLGCLAVPGSNPDGSFDYASMALFINQITGFLLNIAAGIAFLFLIYGSAIVLMSQADPERLNEGKRTVYGAVVGLILALLSNFFLNFIANNILKIPGFS